MELKVKQHERCEHYGKSRELFHGNTIQGVAIICQMKHVQSLNLK